MPEIFKRKGYVKKSYLDVIVEIEKVFNRI